LKGTARVVVVFVLGRCTVGESSYFSEPAKTPSQTTHPSLFLILPNRFDRRLQQQHQLTALLPRALSPPILILSARGIMIVFTSVLSDLPYPSRCARPPRPPAIHDPSYLRDSVHHPPSSPPALLSIEQPLHPTYPVTQALHV
jgi:hypothetical protein